ncbi:hypothetical protein L9F63_023100, partial [Diploptera punctata]
MANATKVKFLYALNFMDIFGFSLFMPLLFDHLRSLQVSHFTIGLLGSIHSGLQLISGTCEHVQTLFASLIAGVAPSDKQSEVQGRVASIAGIAFMIGPIIGGHLGEYNNGFQYVCYICSCIFIINFVNVKLFLSNSHKTKHIKKMKKPTDEKGKGKSEFFRVITDLKNIDWTLYWDIFAFKLFCDFTVGLHYQNLQILLKEYYNVTSSKVGYILALAGLMGAATGFLNGWISKFYKNDKNHA